MTKQSSEFYITAQLITALCIGSLLITSFAFLTYGVLKIKKYVNNHAKGAHIDIKTVFKHLFAQGLYLSGRLILLILDCFFHLNHNLYTDLTGRLTIYALITNCFTSLGGQILLLLILTRISIHKRPGSPSLSQPS